MSLKKSGSSEYYDTKGVEHSVTVEKLGNENDIRAKHNMDPDVWAKEYVAKLNEKEKQENKPVQIELSRSSLITKDHLYTSDAAGIQDRLQYPGPGYR